MVELMPLVFQPDVEGLGPSSNSPEVFLGQFLVSKSVPPTGCWQLSSNSEFFEYSGQTQ